MFRKKSIPPRVILNLHIILKFHLSNGDDNQDIPEVHGDPEPSWSMVARPGVLEGADHDVLELEAGQKRGWLGVPSSNWKWG